MLADTLHVLHSQKREITFDAEARAGMLRGINTVADAVGLTMGPRGRNVVLEVSSPNLWLQPITKP